MKNRRTGRNRARASEVNGVRASLPPPAVLELDKSNRREALTGRKKERPAKNIIRTHETWD